MDLQKQRCRACESSGHLAHGASDTQLVVEIPGINGLVAPWRPGRDRESGTARRRCGLRNAAREGLSSRAAVRARDEGRWKDAGAKMMTICEHTKISRHVKIRGWHESAQASEEPVNQQLADPLSNANRDIEGTSVEFYDAYYSEQDGSFNPDGSYPTSAGSFGAKPPAGGGLDLAEISFNSATQHKWLRT